MSVLREAFMRRGVRGPVASQPVAGEPVAGEPVGPPLGSEAAADIVGALYEGLLGRPAAEAEVAAWLAALATGLSLVDLVRGFETSPERAYIESHRHRLRPSPALTGPPLFIVDVGAAPLPSEGDVFWPLLEAGSCRVTGFEPFTDTHGLRGPDWTMLAHLVGDGSTRIFYETAAGLTSSLYEPNMEAIADFEGLAESCKVVRTRHVDTVQLDSVVDGPVDLLKLDVQGAELDVLRGAERLLADVLVIHTEAEFFPLYRRQPLFDEVFAFLRGHSFDLFDLTHLERYRYRGGEGRGERLLWGDAVFVPSRDRLDELGHDGRAKLIRIIRDVYGAVDFCRWLQTRPTSAS